MSANTPIEVLIIDDDPLSCTYAGAIFRRAGCHPNMVHSGAAALRAARHSPPDLVVLDNGLPGCSGTRMLERLRRVEGARARTVYVAVTGETDPAVHDALRCAGCSRILLKPVPAAQLAACLSLLHPHGSARPPAQGGFQLDTALNQQLAQRLQNEIRQLSRLLDQALADAQLARAADHVHRLRGGAAVCGATQLEQCVAALEQALRDEDIPGIARYYSRYLLQIGEPGVPPDPQA